MTIEQFERRIRNMNQVKVLSGAVSAINKLLIDKKITNENELQDYLIAWLDEHSPRRRPSRRRKRSS